jgi:transcription factor C subunit 3
VFQDALSFDDSVSLGDEWKDWPLTASDGDLVALLELVSNDRVEFNIDTSALQGNCNSADWQSKKIGGCFVLTGV